MNLTCPSCGRELTPAADAMVRCECGFSGSAAYVQEYEYLTARLGWVRDRLAEGAPPPDPATARSWGLWAPAVRAQAPTTSPQTLLVSLGSGLLILAALVFVAVAWRTIGPWGQIVSLLLVTAALAGAAIVIRRKAPRAAEGLAVVSWTLGVICANAATSLGAVPREWGDADRPYRLLVFALAAAWGIVLGRRFGLRAWTWLGWLVTPTVIGLALALALQDIDSDQTLLAVGGMTFVGFGLGLVHFARPPDLLPMRAAAILGLFGAGAATVGAATFEPPAGATLIVAGALLGVVLLRVDLAIWPLVGLLTALLSLFAPEGLWTTVAVGCVGAGLLLLIAIRRPPAVAVICAGTLWTTYLIGTEGQWADTLALSAGLALLAVSLRKEAAVVAWIAAVLLWLAALGHLPEPEVFFELPGLVFAALLLVAGLIARRAGTTASSIVYGPALSVALIPSALLCWHGVGESPSVTRFALVTLAGVILLVIGVNQHMLGLVVPSTAAVAIAGTAQIVGTLNLLPRWLALGLAGAALIAVGARIDWVRSRGRDTEQWLQSLR